MEKLSENQIGLQPEILEILDYCHDQKFYHNCNQARKQAVFALIIAIGLEKFSQTPKLIELLTLRKYQQAAVVIENMLLQNDRKQIMRIIAQGK